MPDRSTLNTPASPLTRRSFLGRFVTVGAAGLGATSLLAACGGEAETGATSSTSSQGVDASSCEGYDALDASALQTRQALGYVDATPREGQNCANCRFYTQPAGASPCGGCQLFAGPVSPDGWCQSWVAKAA